VKRLPELLARLPAQHQQALNWFHENAGTEQPWPQPLDDGLLLATWDRAQARDPVLHWCQAPARHHGGT
jgi:hypothetical protein